MAEQEPQDQTPAEGLDGPRPPGTGGRPHEARDATRIEGGETWASGGHTPSAPYTIHGDAIADTGGDVAAPARARQGPDPIALVAGLVALVLAALAATGTLEDVDPRWVLAAGAVLVGGTVLLVSLRRRG